MWLDDVCMYYNSLILIYVLFKSSLLTLETIGYSLDMHIEYCYGPKWPYWILLHILDCLGQVYAGTVFG